ncbi:sulfurtransferase complex subunit TusC [Neptuniibacter halophilus]|uniref:sulfurtransferase complex subunit TusC n=1 Tax=Neptuniibacter halophilus TaxID=651666 RepID=UPI002573F054|nr:sulfurtransferase complex subunit TusC [Neptuniibacter halophilus]
MSENKSVLIINRSAPYGSSAARESLDVALTCSIFEMPVSLLFLSDGIFQLLQGQSPEALEQKKLEAMLSALPMYDIDQILVCREDFEQHGLSEAQLCLPVQLIDADQIASLIQKHDTVLTF